MYQLTKSGRALLGQYINETLTSDASVYSPRIAGIVFALFAKSPAALSSMDTSIQALEDVLSTISNQQDSRGAEATAGIVLRFYAKVFAAEREALQEAHQALTAMSSPV